VPADRLKELGSQCSVALRRSGNDTLIICFDLDSEALIFVESHLRESDVCDLDNAEVGCGLRRAGKGGCGLKADLFKCSDGLGNFPVGDRGGRHALICYTAGEGNSDNDKVGELHDDSKRRVKWLTPCFTGRKGRATTKPDVQQPIFAPALCAPVQSDC